MSNQTSEFIINNKYKPTPEIENHRINVEQLTYRDCLHLAYLALKDYDIDESVKEQAIQGLSRIWLREIV
jgi:hypothetical protein